MASFIGTRIAHRAVPDDHQAGVGVVGAATASSSPVYSVDTTICVGQPCLLIVDTTRPEWLGRSSWRRRPW